MRETIKNYFKLVKFSHTVFAMPFALLGFFMAVELYNYDFTSRIFIFIILCMVFARNAGMGFNRYADRFIDAKNPRTSNREIPANKIKSRNALIFVIVNSILFIITTYFINVLCFILSLPALVIILLYSYTKRFTYLSHIFIGLALSIAPAAAFIAVTGKLFFPVIILSLLVLFWTAGFDIIYSLQDEVFDRNEKLHSLPARFGRKTAIGIARIFHIISFILSLIFNYLIGINPLNIIGTIIFGIMLFYQNKIVKIHDISKVNLAFGTVNGIASVVYTIIIIISFYTSF
ncbi:MAG TPA: UbiA-like polyprenyltransferase [Bacteroidales bacterium]|jgi:4-hydroxybenzoate polyprenyltransferase|nr:UbiA-like polyprenyltransferase [Bacteroidales bacterium]HOL98622.1 UbiA-like polyprenyltransferase [Bacteroidales bacterium]HOM37006.1 UbiA-like polyprenyltransferase [Bacteroidales bacterium]HPD24108.1 UbiA-like polyprenyltransferase [Bacteroidales bacterium]HRS99318.1 UbiA-like polyprenyltransferase [Bacteroidales bacterium]